MARKKKIRSFQYAALSVLAVFLFGATIWAIYLGCNRPAQRSCPYGYYRSGNLCVQRKVVPRCPTGYVYRGGSCVDSTLRPLRPNPMDTGTQGGGGEGTDL